MKRSDGDKKNGSEKVKKEECNNDLIRAKYDIDPTAYNVQNPYYLTSMYTVQ